MDDAGEAGGRMRGIGMRKAITGGLLALAALTTAGCEQASEPTAELGLKARELEAA